MFPSTLYTSPTDALCQFHKTFSVSYKQDVSAWLRANPGRVVTQFQVAKLYGNAMSTAINGLKRLEFGQ